MLELLTVRQKFTHSIAAARARPQQQTRRPPLLLIDGTDRWTDTRLFYDAYRILCGPCNNEHYRHHVTLLASLM